MDLDMTEKVLAEAYETLKTLTGVGMDNAYAIGQVMGSIQYVLAEIREQKRRDEACASLSCCSAD